jgi:protease-4
MNVNPIVIILSLGILSGCSFDKATEETVEQGPKGPFAVLFEISGELPQFSRSPAAFGPPVMSQYRLEKLLEQASADLRVQEIDVHIGSPMVSLARAQELVDALLRVTLAGKPLVCHIDSVDNVGYWIAAQGCPKILISPAGWVEVLGLSLEAVFLKDFLASMGVTADMINVGNYKDAAEPLTRDTMSDASRKAAQVMLAEIHRILVDGISRGREIDHTAVQGLIDTGPFDAKTALAHRLVDEITPLQAHLDGLHAKHAGGVVDDYGKAPSKKFSYMDFLKLFSGGEPEAKKQSGPRIALVPVVGPIMGGKSEELMGGMNIVRDMALTAALSEIGRDTSVRSVVLRIDSPGGSPLASDNIWHAVRALAKKKPVVASLGDVAASGGYYIASAATEIMAEPATLTGSIGVVGGKLVFDGAVEKLGVKTERIKTGRRASLHSPFTGFDEGERQAIQGLMSTVYDLFVARVAEARGMAKDKVFEVAEGRVWTGFQAKQRGLVNEIGGLSHAVERARQLASLPAGAPVHIEPEPKSLMEMIGEALSEPQVRMTRALSRRHPAFSHGLSLVQLLLDEQVLAFQPTFLMIR